ncbi:MAG: hypothetical protein RLZZ335_953, partial [Bacteroidota bacterium]
MKFLLSTFLVCVISSEAGAQPNRLYIAHYNVENLFDTIDQPETEDSDFTPAGKLKWTQERLNLKKQKIAQVVCAMNSGKGPDVLGLCEVENRAVVEELLSQFPLTK